MEAIDYKWQSECRTKVGMKKRARDYLSSKIFGRAIPDNQDFCWRQLNRDNLPGHTFTFWQWFYSVLGELNFTLFLTKIWSYNFDVLEILDKLEVSSKVSKKFSNPLESYKKLFPLKKAKIKSYQLRTNKIAIHSTSLELGHY